MNLICLKKIIPHKILSLLSILRTKIYKILDSKKPYLNKINYLNFKVYYNRGNGLVSRLFFGNPDRVYERKMCQKITEELKQKKDKIFVDVGANIGLVSLYVLHNIPEVKIYAFEPGSNQNFLFNITIFANEIEEKISLYKKALDFENGQKKFVTHDEVNNCGDGFIDTKHISSGGSKTINVKTITLDDWWCDNGKPQLDVIKIDTEGAELRVLRGAKKVIGICKPVVFLEITKFNLSGYSYDHMDIYKWFVENDYKLFTLDGKECDKNNLDSFLLYEETFIARVK